MEQPCEERGKVFWEKETACLRAREGQPGMPWRDQGPEGLQTPMDKGMAAHVQTKQRTVLKERASLPFYQEIHYSAVLVRVGSQLEL